MRARSNSETADFTAKVGSESPEYRERVARPTMEAVDAMPPEYRELANDFGYIEVYRLWRRRVSVADIRKMFYDKQLTELVSAPRYDNVKY